MPKDRAALFLEKQGLVALFKAQIALLRESDPDGIGRSLESLNLSKYDELLSAGVTARWPAGLLPGLREGIRDVQFMLELAYGQKNRAALLARLREAAGSAVDTLETADAAKLTGIRARGHIRNEREYYLVRSAIDRLEAAIPRDEEALRALYDMVDRASAG